MSYNQQFADLVALARANAADGISNADLLDTAIASVGSAPPEIIRRYADILRERRHGSGLKALRIAVLHTYGVAS